MNRRTRHRIIRITGLTAFFILLNGLTFLAVFAKSEGQLEDKSFLAFTADYLSFLAFPTFKIIDFLAANTELVNTYFVLTAIGLTSLLYTTIVELTIKFTRANNLKKKEKTAANNK